MSQPDTLLPRLRQVAGYGDEAKVRSMELPDGVKVSFFETTPAPIFDPDGNPIPPSASGDNGWLFHVNNPPTLYP